MRSSINSSLQLSVVVSSDKSFDEIGILLLLFFVMDKFYVLIIAINKRIIVDLIRINFSSTKKKKKNPNYQGGSNGV